MKPLTPHARAVLLQEANQSAYDMTVFFFVGALLIIAFWTLVRALLRAENRRCLRLAAEAETNHLRQRCAPYIVKSISTEPLSTEPLSKHYNN